MPLAGPSPGETSCELKPYSLDERAVPRELFPLPRAPLDHHKGAPLSRGVRQRISNRNARDMDVDRCLQSLNRLACGTPQAELGRGTGALRPLSLAQVRVLDFVSGAIESAGRPPDDLSVAEALSQLRIGPGYTCASGPGSYLAADVSLPAVGNTPVPLAELWGPGGDRAVDDFVKSSLLKEADVLDRRGKSGLVAPFSDPDLMRCGRYPKFILSLHQRGIVDFALEGTAREDVGIF